MSENAPQPDPQHKPGEEAETQNPPAADAQADETAQAATPSASEQPAQQQPAQQQPDEQQPDQQQPGQQQPDAAQEQDDSETGPPIQIGSQRTPESRIESRAPDLIAGAPGGEKQSAYPPPRVQKTTPDLEQEIEAAIGDLSLDELMSGEAEAKDPSALDSGERFEARVIRADRENVFFDLGGRSNGVASLRQFKEPPGIGEKMEVAIAGFNEEDGFYEVRVPGASVEVSDWRDLEEGDVIEAMVTGSNKGGLECQVRNIKGFIPASQIATHRVEDFDEYVGNKLRCLVSEANPERRQLVLSARAVIEREQEEHKEEFLKQLEVGQVYEGVVRSVQDFGAFVDLGNGVDGLVHVSQLSWDRVNHPRDVVSEGQRMKVRVEKYDADSGRIGLSYRATLENPWDHAIENYPPGSVVEGEVSKVAKFGAFVKLEPGVEGLIHISELAHHRVVQVTNVVKLGDKVEVKVLEVDLEKQRISLSLKATQAVPEAPQAKKEEEDDDAPPREPIIPERKKPLKGGTNRPTGGEGLGLNW